MQHVMVLHGPNLNLLGSRETSVYGAIPLAEINRRIEEKARQYSLKLTTLQSNSEQVLIESIHQAKDNQTAFIIINPAAFTHTSIALRDALLGVSIPFIEVHVSNIYRRETFRHHSYLSDIAEGTIAGLGWQGYIFALDYSYLYLTTQSKG